MNRPGYKEAPVQTGWVKGGIVEISLKAPLMGRGFVARLVYGRAAYGLGMNSPG